MMPTDALPDPTVDLGVFLDAFFPNDGPYTPERTNAAANLIAGLVRYLNHATYSPNSAPQPPDVDRLLGALASAVWGVPQLLQQTGTLLEGQARSPLLTVDSSGDPLDAPAVAAVAAGRLKAMGKLLEASLFDFDGQHIRPVRAVTSRLYFQEPEAG